MSNAADSPFSRHVAYWSGRWIPYGEIRLSPDDLGFRQAVTAVERCRTYGQRVFELEAHLDRWERTISAIGIGGLPDRDTLSGLVHEAIDRNASLVRSQHDVGVTLFATPGVVGDERPNIAVHLNRLDFARIQRWRDYGQPLVISDVVQPDPGTWPRGIKVRCRLHYYLADRFARGRETGAIGVLLDQDGTLTETGIANLAIIERGRILSPPTDRVLGGITQQVVERMVAECSIPWEKRPISCDSARAAASVLLMGTDAGLWWASSVDGRRIAADPIVRILLDRFDRITGGNHP